MWDVILSGPISGDAQYRVKFAQASVRVKALMPGAQVWNPATLPQGREYAWYMDRCFEAIRRHAAPRCVVLMLPGWNRSPGAVAEWAYARCMGLRVIGIGDWRGRAEMEEG